MLGLPLLVGHAVDDLAGVRVRQVEAAGTRRPRDTSGTSSSGRSRPGSSGRCSARRSARADAPPAGGRRPPPARSACPRRSLASPFSFGREIGRAHPWINHAAAAHSAGHGLDGRGRPRRSARHVRRRGRGRRPSTRARSITCPRCPLAAGSLWSARESRPPPWPPRSRPRGPDRPLDVAGRRHPVRARRAHQAHRGDRGQPSRPGQQQRARGAAGAGGGGRAPGGGPGAGAHVGRSLGAARAARARAHARRSPGGQPGAAGLRRPDRGDELRPQAPECDQGRAVGRRGGAGAGGHAPHLRRPGR